MVRNEVLAVVGDHLMVPLIGIKARVRVVWAASHIGKWCSVRGLRLVLPVVNPFERAPVTPVTIPIMTPSPAWVMYPPVNPRPSACAVAAAGCSAAVVLGQSRVGRRWHSDWPAGTALIVNAIHGR